MAVKGGLPPRPLYPGRRAAAGESRRTGGAGTHRRQEKKAGAALPYLTNGNVATVTAVNTETEDRYGYKRFMF
ncbi:MAG: hypothetical protein ACXAHE_03915 [Roseburia sp. 1XD42-69]|jgi:hypothetical protein